MGDSKNTMNWSQVSLPQLIGQDSWSKMITQKEAKPLPALEAVVKSNLEGQLDILRRTIDRGLLYAEQNEISRMVDMCHQLKDEIERTYKLLKEKE